MSNEEESINRILLKRLARRLDEDEIEDVGYEELAALPEELKPFLWQNMKRIIRKNRYSDEEEDEPLFRRSDIQKDLERLEKLFRSRDEYDDRRYLNYRNPGRFNIHDSHNRGISSEESPLYNSMKYYRIDSDEDLRDILENYKTQLMEYENRKKNYKFMWGQKSNSDGVLGPKDIDTDKAIEALTLISKVESALKDMKGNDSEKFAILRRDSNLRPEMNDEVLTGEILKTKKAKRTIIPTKNEEKVESVYQFYADENKNLQRNTRKADYFSRDIPLSTPLITQNLENKFGEDIFKTLLKNAENRERDLLNLNFQRREKDLPISFDPKDIKIKENNFHGFIPPETMKVFPQEDVYFITEHAEETRSDPLKYKLFMKKAKKPTSLGNQEIRKEFFENIQNPTANFKDMLNDLNNNRQEDNIVKEAAINKLKNHLDDQVYNRELNYDSLKIRDIRPISSPPTNSDEESPKTENVHSITKKSRVMAMGDENSSIDVMQFKNNEEYAARENRRLKREVGDMNKLLNQEMFQQGDESCQRRVVRETDKSDVKKEIKPENVMIIGSNENIDKEELVEEDGSGAHVTDEAIDIVENAPKDQTVLEDKNTEITATNTSTLKNTNRDTRGSKPSLRQLFRKAKFGKDSSATENSPAVGGRPSKRSSNSNSNTNNSKFRKSESPLSTESSVSTMSTEVSKLNESSQSSQSTKPSKSTESHKNTSKSSNEYESSEQSSKKVRETSNGPKVSTDKLKSDVSSRTPSKKEQYSDTPGSDAEIESPSTTEFTLGTKEPGQANMNDTAWLMETIEKVSDSLKNIVSPMKPLYNLKREGSNSEPPRLNILRALQKENSDLGQTKLGPLNIFKRENSDSLLPKDILGEQADIEEGLSRLRESLEKIGDSIKNTRPLNPLKRESSNPLLPKDILGEQTDLEERLSRLRESLNKVGDSMKNTRPLNPLKRENSNPLLPKDILGEQADLEERLSRLRESLEKVGDSMKNTRPLNALKRENSNPLLPKDILGEQTDLEERLSRLRESLNKVGDSMKNTRPLNPLKRENSNPLLPKDILREQADLEERLSRLRESLEKVGDSRKNTRPLNALKRENSNPLLPKDILGEQDNLKNRLAMLRESLDKVGDSMQNTKPLNLLKRESTDSKNILGQQANLEKSGLTLRQSLEKAGGSARNIKSLNNLKRESTDKVPLESTSQNAPNNKKDELSSPKLTPAQRFEAMKTNRENRLAARTQTLKARKEEADKLRIKKAPNTLENKRPLENPKLEEFQRKRAEQLEKLMEKLREKREKILQDYQIEFLDAAKKNSGTPEKVVERRESVNEKKSLGDLAHVMDDNLNEKSTSLADFFKPLHNIRKRKATAKASDLESPKLFQLPQVFRSKKNVYAEDEDSRKSLKDEIETPRQKLFYNLMKNFRNPSVFRSKQQNENFEDPSKRYLLIKKFGKNAVEEKNQSEESSGEKMWDFKDGSSKKIDHSSDSNKETKKLINKMEDQQTRIRRNTEEELNRAKVQDLNIISTSEKSLNNKKKANLKKCNFLCIEGDKNEDCNECRARIYKIVPVENLDFDKSTLKKNAHKKNMNQNDHRLGYNPEVHGQMYHDFPILQVDPHYMRPAMAGNHLLEPHWNYELYPGRSVSPDIYSNYYSDMFQNYPRFGRGLPADFTSRKYNNEFGFHEENLVRSPNPSFRDLIRMISYTSKPLIRHRRQINNEILTTTETNINDIWSNKNGENSDKEIPKNSNHQNEKIIVDKKNTPDYSIKGELQQNIPLDSQKKTKKPKIVKISNSKVESSRNIRKVKTDEEDKKRLQEKSTLDSSIETTGIENKSQNNLKSSESNKNFDKKLEPIKVVHQRESRRSSDETEEIKDSFVQNAMNKLQQFLSFISSMAYSFYSE